jgi:uncharacterized membrane protein YphA (DoxX/SURF4 family)
VNLAKKFNEAMFGWGSPVVFGVVRIVTGLLALTNFLMILVDFDSWFTERGFIPLWHAKKWGMVMTEWGSELPRLNLLSQVTDSRVTMFVYALCLVSCLLTMVGLWTRLSSIVMFVTMVSLHHRAPDILHSGDTLLRQMALYVMLAPSGAACSLDRLIAIYKGKAATLPALVSMWPQRMMQFQVTLVYFTTVWHKMMGTHWRDGTATWFVPQLHEFDRFPVPAFVDTQPFVALTTYGTLVIELAIAFLAYAKPARMWVLLSGVLLHAVIEYRFNIPLFSFVMCSTYLAFYDGEEFSSFAKRLGRKLSRFHRQVALPEGSQLSVRGTALLSAVDPLGLVEVTPGTNSDWVGSDGKHGVSTLIGACPPLWPFCLFKGFIKRAANNCLEPIGIKAGKPLVTEGRAELR